jgi:hypothetical protein
VKSSDDFLSLPHSRRKGEYSKTYVGNIIALSEDRALNLKADWYSEGNQAVLS